jgi:pimeloyl-ACP methyl ester carboxylesterase
MTSSPEFPYGVNPDAVASFLQTEAVDRSQATSRFAGMRHGAADADAIGEIVQRVPKHAWNKLLAAYGAGDARSALEGLRTPTLILHDPENTFIPVEAAQHLHEHIPQSALELTTECRPPHFGERFYARIEAFIDEVAGANAN